MTRGAPQLILTVVPGPCTGQLVTLAGTILNFMADIATDNGQPLQTQMSAMPLPHSPIESNMTATKKLSNGKERISMPSSAERTRLWRSLQG